MRIFISWSGDRSHQVAMLVRDWIRCVIQSVDPWISSEDIDRGAVWFSQISDQLNEVTTGIVCLTKENHNKPWILFESGALAKGISTNRVITLLVDLENGDMVNSPLSAFNHTKPDKEGIFKIIRMRWKKNLTQCFLRSQGLGDYVV